jgi:transcriptional regulator with XRE-family HTH domain
MKELIRLRLAEGCTQAWLAQRTGYGVTTIQQYESGKRKAPLAYVEAVLEVFGQVLSIRAKQESKIKGDLV